MTGAALAHSRTLWNRTGLDLDSDEVLAQLLDRGELTAWRSLYRLAREDAALRRCLARIVMLVPLPMPGFWLAALASLGEPVSFDAGLPVYDGV